MVENPRRVTCRVSITTEKGCNLPGKNFLRDRARNDDGCARHGARDLACTRDPLRAIARDFSCLWPISTPFRAARIVAREVPRYFA